jgi:AcrR family transcriptional regulator
VDAILEATIQVLLSVGKERLTTTRVAQRAGVSVGTLYQYFPNKSALLQSVLQRHLSRVAAALEEACIQQRGSSLQSMAAALINAFLDAKMQDIKTSVALYAVSSDVDGAKIVRHTSKRAHKAIVEMLATAREPLRKDPQLVATLLQSVMTGVSRRLLESPAPEKHVEPLRHELIVLATVYLEAAAKPPHPPAP